MSPHQLNAKHIPLLIRQQLEIREHASVGRRSEAGRLRNLGVSSRWLLFLSVMAFQCLGRTPHRGFSQPQIFMKLLNVIRLTLVAPLGVRETSVPSSNSFKNFLRGTIMPRQGAVGVIGIWLSANGKNPLKAP